MLIVEGVSDLRALLITEALAVPSPVKLIKPFVKLLFIIPVLVKVPVNAVAPFAADTVSANVPPSFVPEPVKNISVPLARSNGIASTSKANALPVCNVPGLE